MTNTEPKTTEGADTGASATQARPTERGPPDAWASSPGPCPAR